MAVGTEAATRSTFGSWVRVHWGAVIAGALFALGVHIVMGLIGAALGFAAEPADSKALGAGAAIWALLTPFVATLLGAWLAIRLTGERESRPSGYVHGLLVWSIGLIAGALFLTGTAATGAMTAGTAASGNLGSAQRMARGNVGQTNATRGDAERSADEAGKAGAAATGGAALAAIAGLLGAVLAVGLADRKREGRGLGWRIAIQRKDERHEGQGQFAGQPRYAGETRYDETYRPATPGAYADREAPRTGELPRDETTDPYHH
jgi:hypothetical protein